jgi:hypothetical protein
LQNYLKKKNSNYSDLHNNWTSEKSKLNIYNNTNSNKYFNIDDGNLENNKKESEENNKINK